MIVGVYVCEDTYSIRLGEENNIVKEEIIRKAQKIMEPLWMDESPSPLLIIPPTS